MTPAAILADRVVRHLEHFPEGAAIGTIADALRVPLIALGIAVNDGGKGRIVAHGAKLFLVANAPGLTDPAVALPDADVGAMREEVERLRARVVELEAREAARLTADERLIVAEGLAARAYGYEQVVVAQHIANYERWLTVAQFDKAAGAPPRRG